MIAACCASAHWPWVLNGQPVARTSDGSAWLDGGLRYYLTGSLDSYLPPAAVQFSAAASAVAAGMELSGAAAAPTSAALEAATPILVFDPSSDTQLAHERFTVGGSVLKIPELKEVTALVDLGYAYSRRMQEQGAYDMCLLPLAVGGAGAPPTLQLQ